MSYPNPPNSTAPQTPEPLSPDKRTRNRLIIIVAVVLVILMCCCLAVAALLYFDPFDWGLLSRFTGGYDAIAQAAPSNTSMYVGVNLLNVTPDKTDPLISAFRDAFEEYTGESVADSADFMDQVDETLDEFDMTLEDDIIPWIGQYAGIGILDLDLDRYGNADNVDVYFAVETRNQGAADDFLEKLADEISDAWDVRIDTTHYQDTIIYFVDESYNELAFARDNSLVILANSEDTIREVINVQRGDSLADDPVYRDLMSELPSERVLTFYMPTSALEEIYSVFAADIGIVGTSVEDIYRGTSGIAFSMAIVDAGLQFDSVAAYDPNELSDSRRQLMDATGRGNNTASQLPSDTIVYFSGQRLDLTWATNYEVLSEATDGDIDEAMSELEDEIGFNPNSDLFPYLDGSYAISVFPSDSGFLYELADINLGFAIIAQTSDEDAVLDAIENFNDALEDNGGGEVDDVSTRSMTLFEAIDTYMEEPIMVYGVGEGWMALASAMDPLEAFPNPPDALSDNDTYRRAENYLPSGMSLVAYVDLESGLDVIRDNLDSYDRDNFDESTFFLNPIEALVAGTSSIRGNMVHSTFILIIPTNR